MTVSLRHQAEEAELEFLETRDWIATLENTQDAKAKRTPEQIALLKIRLVRKEAIAETIRRLADRADARRVADHGSTAA